MYYNAYIDICGHLSHVLTRAIFDKAIQKHLCLVNTIIGRGGKLLFLYVEEYVLSYVSHICTIYMAAFHCVLLYTSAVWSRVASLRWRFGSRLYS